MSEEIDKIACSRLDSAYLYTLNSLVVFQLDSIHEP